MFNSPGRPVGVVIPNAQRPQTRGEPRTVSHAVPCSMVAVQYYDEDGTEHRSVLLRVANKLYVPPNSENWAGALKESAGWLAKGVEGLISDSGTVPTADSVDVLKPTPKPDKDKAP